MSKNYNFKIDFLLEDHEAPSFEITGIQTLGDYVFPMWALDFLSTELENHIVESCLAVDGIYSVLIRDESTNVTTIFTLAKCETIEEM